MQPHRRVILLVEAASAYARGCLRGIARYARSHGGWVLFHDTRHLTEPVDLETLRDWNADGVIARIENDHIAAAVRELALPTVDIRGSINLSSIPSVITDDTKVVDLAGGHLQGNGLRRLAFCGFPGVDYSDARQAAFIGYCKHHKLEHHVFTSPASVQTPMLMSYQRRGVADLPVLQQWLGDLPKPIGVIACNDTRGRQVLQACAAANIRVPYDISVVGVDDDDVVCELSHPSMTSVAPNTELVGFEAAGLLDRMLDGKRPPRKPVLIPPVAIETRGSSDTIALNDPQLVKAVRFIRSRIATGVSVKEVLEEVQVSRSTFERQFREHFDCTPYEYVMRCRVDRIKQLLIDTNYPLAQISRMAGFKNPAHMTAVFRQRTGQTPGAYRLAQG